MAWFALSSKSPCSRKREYYTLFLKGFGGFLVFLVVRNFLVSIVSHSSLFFSLSLLPLWLSREILCSTLDKNVIYTSYSCPEVLVAAGFPRDSIFACLFIEAGGYQNTRIPEYQNARMPECIRWEMKNAKLKIFSELLIYLKYFNNFDCFQFFERDNKKNSASFGEWRNAIQV